MKHTIQFLSLKNVLRTLAMFLCLANNAMNVHAQLPVHIDSIYTFVKYNSVHRQNIDWVQTDSLFKYQLAQAKSTHDTMQCIVSVLEILNDVHSQIYLNGNYYGYYHTADHFAAESTVWEFDRLVRKNGPVLKAEMINKYGYVVIPTCSVYTPDEINSMTESIFDKVDSLNKNKPQGFIIDLRFNGGGNLYPMLAGLSGLLGDGVVAYETDLENQAIRTWEIQGANLYMGEYQVTQLSRKVSKKLNQIPVAVLISPYTKSSGSMTAIAFKTRNNTTFIGEATADGYTTSNGYFQFAPNLIMNFATHFVADRAMNVYKTTVDPDIFCQEGIDFENPSRDFAVIKAIEWFKSLE